MNPFNANGVLGKMWKLFDENTDETVSELNKVMAAL
jgi:hypothetical protein